MLYYAKPHTFTAEEIQVARNIADHVSFAVERKQREEEIRKLNAALLEKIGDYERVVQQLEQSQAELEQKVNDLEKFEEVAVGRELKMMALERELAKLKEERGHSPHHDRKP
jgi:GAF domain-containing protein